MKFFLTLSVFCVGSLLVTHAPAQDAKPVVVARVTEAKVNVGQRVVGTVRPLRTSTIGSAVDGRVEEFRVNRGEAVTKNQVLAQLRTGTLEIEQAAAAAELELAVQRLAELENGSRPEDIAEAEANARGAEAALNNADRSLKRMQSLATTRAASTADLDNAKQRADTARFAHQAAEALLKRIKEGPRTEAIAQAGSQVELQQQRLNLIKDRIAKFTIVAPFDGFVSAEFTEVGAWISRGDLIAEVIQMNEVEIEAPVTAEAAVNLRRGDSIRVEFPELPNELLTGTIDRIVPIASMRSRTFPVQIRLSNPIEQGTPLLSAGMMARVELPAGKREKLPLVPKDALVLNGKDRSVFVVDGEPNDKGDVFGNARKVPVTLGVAVQDRLQVRGDIKVNDLVVVVGNERLTPNAKVKVIRDASADLGTIKAGLVSE